MNTNKMITIDVWLMEECVGTERAKLTVTVNLEQVALFKNKGGKEANMIYRILINNEWFYMSSDGYHNCVTLMGRLND